jgi:hypothetical protein
VHRAGLAAARNVVDGVGLAVDDVHPQRAHRLDRRRRVGLVGDRVADHHVVDDAAVVHQHPDHVERVLLGHPVAVAGRQLEHLALLARRVHRLACARKLGLLVERRDRVAGGMLDAELREDDVVQHHAVDRDLRAVGVHDVDAHARDEALDAGGLDRRGLLDLEWVHRDRVVERLGHALRHRGRRRDCEQREYERAHGGPAAHLFQPSPD